MGGGGGGKAETKRCRGRYKDINGERGMERQREDREGEKERRREGQRKKGREITTRRHEILFGPCVTCRFTFLHCSIIPLTPL